MDNAFDFLTKLSKGMAAPFFIEADMHTIITIPLMIYLCGAYTFISLKEFWEEKSFINFLIAIYRPASLFLSIALIEYSFWDLGNGYAPADNWYRNGGAPIGHSSILGWGFSLLNIALFWCGQILGGNIINFKKDTPEIATT